MNWLEELGKYIKRELPEYTKTGGNLLQYGTKKLAPMIGRQIPKLAMPGSIVGQLDPENRRIFQTAFSKEEIPYEERIEAMGQMTTMAGIGMTGGLGSKAKAIQPIKEKAVPIFKGLKNLTTKILNRLKGKSLTSKQEILDFTNMPDVRQAEKNLIRDIVDDYKGEKIPVKKFADKVETELLPLTQKSTKGFKSTKGEFPYLEPRYESTVLPDDLRGNVANYGERIYESPIEVFGLLPPLTTGRMTGEEKENRRMPIYTTPKYSFK